jgi:addiction module antidote protein, HigA family
MRAIHPGEILREDILPELNMSAGAFAGLLGVSRMNIYRIVKGKQAITPDMALRLSKLLGNSAEFWLNLQNSYDLQVAEKGLSKELKAIKRLRAI